MPDNRDEYYLYEGFGCRRTTFVVSALLAWQVFSSDSNLPELDPRCESQALSRQVTLPIHQACLAEKDRCVKARLSSSQATSEQAEESCEMLSLNLDPSFVGPCPLYMEELETATYDDDLWILRRISVRRDFQTLNEWGRKSGISFKQNESVAELRRFRKHDPDNAVVLQWLSFHLPPDEAEEKLQIQVELHRLDPDCPTDRWIRQRVFTGHVLQVALEWLADQGSSAKLSYTERRGLIEDARSALLDMYDIAITREQGTRRLYWALESVHDRVLSPRGTAIKQIHVDLNIDFEEIAETRTATLIEAFAKEYSVDSEHGRTQSLQMLCNEHAFELGLFDHCEKLLDYFGRKDAEMFDEPEADWMQGAILVLNWLTRDCSPHASFLLGASHWRNERRCPDIEVEQFRKKMNILLAAFQKRSNSSGRALLGAYLRLDETSVDGFLHALSLDVIGTAPYGARLTKRLQKKGYVDAASSILGAIHTERNLRLTRAEQAFLEDIQESVNEGTYQNIREPHRYAFYQEERVP